MKRQAAYYLHILLKHDFRAGITVFFVALPLCLGVALASGAPAMSGLMAGIIGGLVIPLISRSELSVSGPAAGLTAISAAAIAGMGSIQVFFMAVALAGIMQVLLGVFRLGDLSQFIPTAVIKGMLAAIGVILIIRQVPLLVGYDRPDFWTNELVNILTFHHSLQNLNSLYLHTSAGAVLLSILSLLFLVGWKKTKLDRISFLPASFITVVFGAGMAWLLSRLMPSFSLAPAQFVSLPLLGSHSFSPPAIEALALPATWRTALVICIIASLETLLSITAIDKLDPYNRISPQNRELVAQGAGNFLSGLLGGLPITSVIVRSSANAEAGARTRLSTITHAVWLLLALAVMTPLINHIPYCVLAIILARTGYNLAKPSMIASVYRQGREQFLPFIVTLMAILFTDILTGAGIGFAFSVYFLVRHTYRAGFTIREAPEGHTRHYTIDMAMNVSFLNKKKIQETLDRIPPYSIVEVNAARSIYIDLDVLEVFEDFRVKAHRRHIELTLNGIRRVETIGLH